MSSKVFDLFGRDAGTNNKPAELAGNCPQPEWTLKVVVVSKEEFFPKSWIKVNLSGESNRAEKKKMTAQQTEEYVFKGNRTARYTVSCSPPESWSLVEAKPVKLIPGSVETVVLEITTTLTWIGIQLIDASGRAVTGLRYSLETASTGQRLTGTLGADGLAKHTQIRRGNFTVTFPDLHKDLWKPAADAKVKPELPPINMETLTTLRQQGYVTAKTNDTMLSLAETVWQADWKNIWNEPSNAGLRQLRPDPNMLLAGDRISLPPPERDQKACECGKVNVFLVEPPNLYAVVDLVLRNRWGIVLAGTPYDLEVEGTSLKGSTDANGRMCEAVPLHAKKGKLTIWPAQDSLRFSWILQFSTLGPVVDSDGHQTGGASGWEGRLRNLGFEGSSEQALRAFQEYVSETRPTGQPDDSTLVLLEALHNAL